MELIQQLGTSNLRVHGILVYKLSVSNITSQSSTQFYLNILIRSQFILAKTLDLTLNIYISKSFIRILLNILNNLGQVIGPDFEDLNFKLVRSKISTYSFSYSLIAFSVDLDLKILEALQKLLLLHQKYTRYLIFCC